MKGGFCKAILAVLLCLACVLPCAADGETDQNLIKNGDFELLSAAGLPTGWYTDAWVNTPGFTEYQVVEGMEGNAASIVNIGDNDARFAQVVDVEPDTLYCLSGWIKADASDAGRGANLSVEGLYVFSEGLYQTEGAFQQVRLYGYTGPEQTAMTVFARLGGYSGETQGEAVFDDIRLEKVEDVPDGIYIEQFYTQSDTTYIAPETQTAATDADWVLIAGLALLGLAVLCAGCAAAAREAREREGILEPLYKTRRELYPLSFLLLGALAVRLVVALSVPGFGIDIGCFTAWAGRMASVGAPGFYADGYFCDYPPGYVLVLGVVGLLGRVSGGVSEMMIKGVPIAADLVAIVLLYACARRFVRARGALAISALYAVNPAALLCGAAWGQSDGVLAVLLLGVFWLAMNRNWRAAIPVFIAAALIKPQALMFAPLGLTAVISDLARRHQGNQRTVKRSLWDWLRRTEPGRAVQGVFIALAAALAVVLPFSARQTDPLWLFNLYGGTLSYYNYATVNAANVFYLASANWGRLSAEASLPLCAALSVALMGCGALRLSRGTKDALSWGALASGGALMVLALCFTVTYTALGWGLMALCIAATLYIYVRGGSLKHLPMAGGVLLTLLFTFGTQMHERYAYCAIVLYLLAFALTRDRRALALMIGVSLTTFLNAGFVMNIYALFESTALNAYASADIVSVLCAVANCALSALGLYTLCDHCLYGKTLTEPLFKARVRADHSENQNQPETPDPLLKPEPERRVTKKDAFLLLPLTVLYCVVALCNLGSVKAPQTSWGASAANETIVLDLGDTHTFSLLYFAGIQTDSRSVTFEVSEDGAAYGDPYTASMDYGQCFQWKYAEQYTGMRQVFTGRYVRVTAQTFAVTLHEIVARDADTGEALPMTVHSVLNRNEKAVTLGAPDCLVDEPDSIEGEPGWYNSAYFDEIYHARTAYEHLHGIYPYETTHPPLGKLIMSVGIALFGMTPFGWRFMGAMAGVFMLPGMYMLGKMLFKRRSVAFAAAFLMAADCMHLAQTRIATIDSFVTLFIIWSYVFMFRYALMDHFGADLRKGLVNLILSGLFIGVAIASKWTGCYAAVGLAVIFFGTVYRQHRQSRRARALLKTNKADHKKAPDRFAGRESALTEAATGFQSRLLITLGVCVACFVIVPVAIYFCSYIPYFSTTGGVTAQRVIDATLGAYHYHAQPGLGMDHQFYSPWYEWPLSLTPMYFAVDYYEPSGLASSVLSFGNIWIWWTGALAVVFLIVLWTRERVRVLRGASDPARIDLRPGLLLVSFAVQYLPWVLVPRGTYIYHYFPSLPFVILSVTCVMEWALDRARCAADAPLRLSAFRALGKPQKWMWVSVLAYLVIALAFFVAFYPYASGVPVSYAWRRAMQWLPDWLYF